jgi:hypothetical protein
MKSEEIRKILWNITRNDWGWLDPDGDVALLFRWQADDNALGALNAIVTRIKAKEATETEETVIIRDLVNFALYAKHGAEQVNQGWRKVADLHHQQKPLRPKMWRLLEKLPREYTEEAEPHLRMSDLTLPIRSDKDGSRARTLFLRDFSNSVHDCTGFWMDAQVAAIANAVFNREDIEPEHVHQARRPTTRAGRRPKR